MPASEQDVQNFLFVYLALRVLVNSFVFVCRLDLGKMTPYSFGGLMPIMAAGLPEFLPVEERVTVWPLGIHWMCLVIKGSVERLLLPSAIFLIFTRNRAWKSEDHLCTLFFIEMSNERLKKSERTPPVSWHPWGLAYSRDRPYNFSWLSAMLKNGRLRSFILGFGCHLESKSLSLPTMPISNKKQEFEQRKRNKLFDDFRVRAYRFDFAPRRRPRARLT